MLTVKELRELLATLPDDAVILSRERDFFDGDLVLTTDVDVEVTKVEIITKSYPFNKDTYVVHHHNGQDAVIISP